MLLQSYLSDRKQRVVLNGCTSDTGEIQSGVPQGSVLGPLLFLIFINDLETDIVSHVKMFADDTMIFDVVRDLHLSSETLNQDLARVGNWALQWKMSFGGRPVKNSGFLQFYRKSKTHPFLCKIYHRFHF